MNDPAVVPGWGPVHEPEDPAVVSIQEQGRMSQGETDPAGLVAGLPVEECGAIQVAGEERDAAREG
jgi:hypothetical protein